MKSRMNCTLMLITAVLTLGAAEVSGQGPLTAQVPFSFNIKGAELLAGKYTIARTSGERVLELRDLVSGNVTFAMIKSSAAEEIPGDARLIFQCGDLSGCSLIEVWNGSGDGWKLVTPHIAPDVGERRVVVLMNRRVGQ